MSIRDDVAAGIRAGLPKKGYLVVTDDAGLGKLDRITIVVSQQGFAPHADAPATFLNVRFTVRVISPLEKRADADDQLTDAVTDITRLIDTLAGVTWTDAQKIIHNETYLAYDVSVETITNYKEA